MWSVEQAVSLKPRSSGRGRLTNDSLVEVSGSHPMAEDTPPACQPKDPSGFCMRSVHLFTAAEKMGPLFVKLVL